MIMEILSAICGISSSCRNTTFAKRTTCIFVFFFCLFFAVAISKTNIYAGEFNNAYDYYNSFGNNAYFKPESATEGYIYFVSKGNKSTAGTKYKTIGWQLQIKNNDGKLLQTLYFMLNGNFLKSENMVVVNNYEYNLYKLKLGKMTSRFSQQSKKALNSGNCQLIFNACMVVQKNGKAGGSMNDSGITKGKVYTTYDGIVGAAGWSDSAKKALNSYFNKSVIGLFYNVNVNKTTGISKISGGGVYCYGTKATIEATVDKGYSFSNWNSNSKYSTAKTSFYVNSNTTWTAYARQKSLVVTLYRNIDSNDKESRTQTFYYSGTGQKLNPVGWMNPGYHLTGWNESRNSKIAKYNPEGEIKQDLINSRSPKMSLYAVWEPNNYQFVFEGEDCENIKSINAKYGESINLPAPISDHATFIGWSFGALDTEAEYKAGDNLLVSDAADKQQVLNTDNAVITLYAIWDQLPAIDAEDTFYAIKDIEKGIITEEHISSNYSASDKEDGEIPYGLNSNSNTYFKIINFPEQEIQQIKQTKMQGGKIPKVEIRLEAKDSVGNIVNKTVYIHFADTSIRGKKQTFGKVRFINKKYYKNSGGDYVNEKAGGLLENSCWYMLDDYRRTIELALSAT